MKPSMVALHRSSEGFGSGFFSEPFGCVSTVGPGRAKRAGPGRRGRAEEVGLSSLMARPVSWGKAVPHDPLPQFLHFGRQFFHLGPHFLLLLDQCVHHAGLGLAA